MTKLWHFLFDKSECGESIAEAFAAGILSIAVIALLIFIAYMAG